MKAIKFLTDYRGVLTNEQFYKAGAVVELAQASALVNDGRAEFVDLDPLPIPVKPESVSAPALDELNVKALKDMAKAAGIKGYSRMKRETLLKHLKEK